jgi:hypothetical protein
MVDSSAMNLKRPDSDPVSGLHSPFRSRLVVSPRVFGQQDYLLPGRVWQLCCYGEAQGDYCHLSCVPARDAIHRSIEPLLYIFPRLFQFFSCIVQERQPCLRNWLRQLLDHVAHILEGFRSRVGICGGDDPCQAVKPTAPVQPMPGRDRSHLLCDVCGDRSRPPAASRRVPD